MNTKDKTEKLNDKDLDNNIDDIDKKNRAIKIYKLLDKAYPDAECELVYQTPFQLLVSTMLSAQATDKSVNNVTKEVYKEYPDLDSFLTLSIEQLENMIRKIGLYKNKSKNIYNMCRELQDLYGGEVPKTIEELTQLSGVGRKTASVVLAEAYKIPAFPVDTHVQRVTTRLELTNQKTPDKISDDIMKLLPKKYWIKAHHLFIRHGRATCSARSLKCDICVLNKLCHNQSK